MSAPEQSDRSDAAARLDGLPFTRLHAAIMAVCALGLDVSSWYIIKLFHPFVYVEIAAGGVLAACFGFMWLVTLYQIWFSSAPTAVQERQKGDLSVPYH